VDRHVYPKTGALCLGFPAELWVLLRGDFSLGTFITRAIVPYLIGNSLVEEGKPWPFNESSHGPLGGLEFYERFIGSKDPSIVGQFLVDLMSGKVRGHWPCPCGSGLVLRKCHGEAARELRQIPAHVISHSIQAMIDLMKIEIDRARSTRR